VKPRLRCPPAARFLEFRGTSGSTFASRVPEVRADTAIEGAVFDLHLNNFHDQESKWDIIRAGRIQALPWAQSLYRSAMTLNS
jgi:hypothetical protein